ncbi:hypothetical protein FBUS_01254 [Fasciolopsis buskii]|uniref:Uncharacterized protein n=1 Tax=Fasciolopsis buskii TaxID=27845 RepID=A0A8E0VGU8_9TREM|nr:hypothetical protein FBUS_01254 [Fasciolopsis buski]
MLVLLNAYPMRAETYTPYQMDSEPIVYDYDHVEPGAYWNVRKPIHSRIGPSPIASGRVNKKSFLLDSRLDKQTNHCRLAMSATNTSPYRLISLLMLVLLNAYPMRAETYTPYQMDSEPIVYDYDHVEPGAYWNVRRPIHSRIGPSPIASGRVNKKSFLLDSRLG